MTTRVLSVASECVPLVKTGGLADVVGALPSALAPLGIDMAVLLPGYPQVLKRLKGKPTGLKKPPLMGGKARVLSATLEGTQFYILDAPHLFDRPGTLYLDAEGRDWPDNPERFAALSWIAAHIGARGIDGWQPDVLHLHDWQAGLAPVYLADMGAADRVATLTTIHNIAFQGIAPADRLAALHLPKASFTRQGFEYYGAISTLKAGLVFSDAISTVSPTYAAELMRPEFGMGLEGVLREREHDLHGILNGIDTAAWTPPFKTLKGKARHTAALRRAFNLAQSEGPLAVVVSRLSEQKGLDLLLDALPRLVAEGGQLALLGTGDPALETAFLRAADGNPNVAVHIGYDEDLARQMMAGGDMILIPSRFEPCGLTQLYGLRYGTIPLVALTGGLADTVVNANTAALATGTATGFQFAPVTADALRRTISQAARTFQDKPAWQRLQKNAMAQPVGWEVSAQTYATLLKSLKKPQ